jgi:ssDNA-binding Zn-finger/Zn-ribbon topoisomerase 1
MERFKGENLAKEIFTKFDLEDLLINPNLNGEFCPLCQIKNIINFIVPKFSRNNKQMFYGCSAYPVCKFTESFNSNSYGQKRQKNKTFSSSSGSSNDDYSDLFGNTVKGKQWETPICYWSSVKLPGYIYSKKKNAWWKRKPNK